MVDSNGTPTRSVSVRATLSFQYHKSRRYAIAARHTVAFPLPPSELEDETFDVMLGM